MESATVRIDPREEIGFMHVDETDFGSFTTAQRIRHLRSRRLRASTGHARRRSHRTAEGRAGRCAHGMQGLQRLPDLLPGSPVAQSGHVRLDRASAHDRVPRSADGCRTSCLRAACSRGPCRVRRPFPCIRTASPTALPFSATRAVRRGWCACFIIWTTSRLKGRRSGSCRVRTCPFTPMAIPTCVTSPIPRR